MVALAKIHSGVNHRALPQRETTGIHAEPGLPRKKTPVENGIPAWGPKREGQGPFVATEMLATVRDSLESKHPQLQPDNLTEGRTAPCPVGADMSYTEEILTIKEQQMKL